MRRVVLYLAMSLDGFVADQNGKVEWLTPFEGEDTYTDFERTVDTIVMGRRTYAQIVTELSPNQWVYPNQTSYVITHEVCTGTEAVRFVDQDPVTLVDTLKKQEGKDIWINGGPTIIQPLIQANLIDQYRLTIVPVLLGAGTRLFQSADRIHLKSVGLIQHGQLFELIYEKEDDAPLSFVDEREVLLDHIDKLHSTPMGLERVSRNLGCQIQEVTAYCQKLIQDPTCQVWRKGKNVYCRVKEVEITINAHGYTIITAHRIRTKSMKEGK